jgi:hypothetical protein
MAPKDSVAENKSPRRIFDGSHLRDKTKVSPRTSIDTSPFKTSSTVHGGGKRRVAKQNSYFDSHQSIDLPRFFIVKPVSNRKDVNDR